MEIRPLTREDLLTWWDSMPVARSVRGFSVEDSGRLMGVAGLIYLRTAVVGFMEMVPEGQRYPMTIMRVVRLMQKLIGEVSAPVFAVADPQYHNSEAFLERVGFQRVSGRQFVFMQEGR